MNAIGNLSFSKNKVMILLNTLMIMIMADKKSISIQTTDIAFSPAIVGGATINFLPVKNFELSLLSKYVSKQYLDNTQNESRKLNAFYIQDVRAHLYNKKEMAERNKHYWAGK